MSRARLKPLEIGYNGIIKFNNVIGVFDKNTSSKPLIVRRFGNGAVIPFIKQFIGKEVVVIVFNGLKK